MLIATRRTVPVPETRKRCPAISESFAKDGTNRRVEPPDFLRRQAAGVAQRMELGTKKRFVDIDVTETGDQRLIEQDAFQAPAPATQ
jgi:hypothetical protein